MPRYSLPPFRVGPALGALVLALAGLFSTWIQARFQPVPTPPLADLQGGAVAGYVRVHGVLPEPPRWEPEGPRLRFRLSDGTAELRVLANGPVAAALAQAKRIPRAGDVVTVEGRLREDRGPSLAGGRPRGGPARRAPGASPPLHRRSPLCPVGSPRADHRADPKRPPPL